MDGGRLPEAADLLESIWSEWPFEHRFGLNYISCLNGMDRHVEVGLAIEQFLSNIRDGSVWARDELENLREEAEKYGVKLPRVKSNDDEDATQVAEIDVADPAAEDQEKAGDDEVVESEKPTEEMPRKLSFRIRKVMSLLQPMRATVEWMILKNQIALGNHDKSRKNLVKIMNDVEGRPNPDLHNQIGFCLLQVDEEDSARICFERALDTDDENASARQGIAEVALRKGDWEALIEHALTSTELRFQNPRVHYLLGRGLDGAGDLENARIAYGVAIQQAPSFPEARHSIIDLLERIGETEEAEVHREFLSKIDDGQNFDRAVESDDTEAVWSSIAGARDERRAGLFENREAPDEDGVGDETTQTEPITIVSGLPRSGTSMMMQMLVGGGLEPFTDDKRKADSDNPRGYIEHEKATRIAADHSWIPEVRGGVFKLVAQLLVHLPKGERYKVVFMDRDLREIVKSQKVMLDRLGREGGRLTDSRMMQTLDAQLSAVERMLSRRDEIQVLFVDYDDVLSDPGREAGRIAEFVGGDLDAEAMSEAVDGSLRRQQNQD